MAKKVRQYVAIDAKSFYASVECVERHLNPLTTNLVVADESRTEKTIFDYVSSEDIIIYSIDEVFIDVTDYLRTYGMTTHELTMTMVCDVLYSTGITAMAGTAWP